MRQQIERGDVFGLQVIPKAPLSRSLSLALSLSHSLSLALSLSFSLSRALSLSLSFSLSRALSGSLALSLSLHHHCHWGAGQLSHLLPAPDGDGSPERWCALAYCSPCPETGGSWKWLFFCSLCRFIFHFPGRLRSQGDSHYISFELQL